MNPFTAQARSAPTLRHAAPHPFHPPLARSQRKKREERLEELHQKQVSELERYEQQSKLQSIGGLDPSLASLQPPDVPQHSAPEVSYDAAELDKFLPASAQVDQALPPPRLPGTATYEPPSRARMCLAKLQSGFMLGSAVGGSFGFAYGTFAAIKYRHILYLPIAVVQAISLPRHGPRCGAPPPRRPRASSGWLACLLTASMMPHRGRPCLAGGRGLRLLSPGRGWLVPCRS